MVLSSGMAVPNAVRPPRAAISIFVLVLAVVAVATGCGGGGSAATAGTPAVFSLGTVNRIDSLNPFVLTEPQAFTVADVAFPQLVSYAGADGTRIVGDWASSWQMSADGRLWRFHLRPGSWSDGKPLTAADAVWTIRTELRYRASATALVAAPLAGIRTVSAPDPHTLVIRYARPVGDALAQLASVWILPEHVWKPLTGNHGRDLKAYQPEQHLPMVGGGPYTVTRYSETGTTVLRTNPGFYGPKPPVRAIAISFYTNPVSLIAAFQQGDVTAVDQVPDTATSDVRKMPGVRLADAPDATVVPILVNSNPAKKRNRELLDLRVRQAISLAVNRRALVSVPFRGDAKPWGNWIPPYSGRWVDPVIKPSPYDPARANDILNSLGFRRGSNGIRMVPATTGRYAQPAHPMSYSFAVPGDLPYDGDRAEAEIAQNLQAVGIAIHEVPAGDTAASYAYYQGPNGSYQNSDLGIWYYESYIDPTYMLQYPTTAQWDDYNDTGFSDPAYDRLFALQGRTVNQTTRREIVWEMERLLAAKLPYIPLVTTGGYMAYDSQWEGVNPALYGWKSFFEQLRSSG
jgi:peptide/nickel transport system substrate-binding protein